MKTLLRFMAAAAALLMLLTACAPKELTFTGETPEGVFRADEAVQQAFAEAEKADGAAYTGVEGGTLLQIRVTETGGQAVVSPDGDRLTQTRYQIDGQTRTGVVTAARYQRGNGDWYEYRYDPEEGTQSDEPLWLKLSDPSPANVGGEKSLPAELAKKTDVTLYLALGKHDFYYTEDEENGVVWYLEAPLSVAFTDKSKRDSFRRQHPGGDAQDVGESEYLWTASALLRLTGADLSETGFADTIDLMTSEFNDPVRYQIRLGERGEIQSFRSGVE